MRHILYRRLKTLIISRRFIRCNYRKIPLLIPNSKLRLSFLNASFATAAATILNLPEEESQEKNDYDIQFSKEVQEACSKNDSALKELIQVLSSCVIEISKEYQQNITQQIELIKRCTQLGPVGEHWDDLTRFRVEATELRQELTKYEALVQKVGQMAYNQAVTSLLSGIENAMDLLEVDFRNLENLVKRLTKENYESEMKLLRANRDSILHGVK